MQVVCGSWIRWMVSRIISCPDKLGGGREREELQRTARRYDDEGHGKYVGLRLLLLAAVAMAPRALPPQTNRRRMKKKKGTGRKCSQLCLVQGYGAFNLLILKVLCKVHVVGSVLSFSAQPYTTIEFSH